MQVTLYSLGGVLPRVRMTLPFFLVLLLDGCPAQLNRLHHKCSVLPRESLGLILMLIMGANPGYSHGGYMRCH